MPTYEYECNDCGHRFEVFQKITDDPVTACEKCSGQVRKVLFPVGILFKGSGFHVNDYRKPEPPSGNGDGKTTDSKPEPSKETV
ncbi:MAG: zinc ribbon domain-containing protein [Armatimonadetes bacterium]|nr:zinc ribbon domain-containing protein [Armatimonadota bacterium]